MALRLGVGTLLFGLLLAVSSKGITGHSSRKASHKRMSHNDSCLNRSTFPAGFMFGTASAAYQFEGAANEGGRGPCVWDAFTHKYPEKIKDRSSGDMAADQYHRYKEDVKMLKEMGWDAYRFSISWSRLLPNGKLSGGVNQEGIKYYKNLINELVSHGLIPFVTLFHWDTPQALEEDYGGFLSPQIVKHFQDYAELCYKEFGDKVKHWTTLNEPHTYSVNGYATGGSAPGRCSAWKDPNCTGGDSGTEPYLVSHHLLLAHAAAVQVYKEKFQAKQKGLIGIVVNTGWFMPYSDSKRDHDAAQRTMDFNLGWFMDPLTHGDYPQIMRSLVGNRLPKFTKEQSDKLKGSFDFIGMNYYSGGYSADLHTKPDPKQPSYTSDSLVNVTFERNGVPIGPVAASSWLLVFPQGFLDLLLYIKNKYNNPTMYITENGWDEVNDPTWSLEKALDDSTRIEFYDQHLRKLQAAIKAGVKVKGYFAWSFLDNFEWADGYTVRFGLVYVDYKNEQKRHPKKSVNWFKNFLHKSKE
ncbi:PREDICTED: beta-glucosidase 12-like [Fragaria vesca subsp. vesca]|uniref:beta-glucosidase 12-like n=1 Tax=Fragaria vesca subsp. vesca TaxID=101020 RepID=UPI0002C2FD74|nr:PREDICTED: beta-glucosidase 12-like [Fragaria vesca subsp. vesca]